MIQVLELVPRPHDPVPYYEGIPRSNAFAQPIGREHFHAVRYPGRTAGGHFHATTARLKTKWVGRRRHECRRCRHECPRHVDLHHLWCRAIGTHFQNFRGDFLGEKFPRHLLSRRVRYLVDVASNPRQIAYGFHQPPLILDHRSAPASRTLEGTHALHGASEAVARSAWPRPALARRRLSSQNPAYVCRNRCTRRDPGGGAGLESACRPRELARYSLGAVHRRSRQPAISGLPPELFPNWLAPN